MDNHQTLNTEEIRTALRRDFSGDRYIKFGSKQEDIDKALEKMNDPSSRNFGNMALGFFTYLIGWFIVAVIISLIVKKKKPEFADAQF